MHDKPRAYLTWSTLQCKIKIVEQTLGYRNFKWNCPANGW